MRTYKSIKSNLYLKKKLRCNTSPTFGGNIVSDIVFSFFMIYGTKYVLRSFIDFFIRRSFLNLYNAHLLRKTEIFLIILLI